MLTAQQLTERKRGIGGSDVAAILGLTSYKTPLDVFNEKVNDVTRKQTEPMKWGLRLEDAIAAEYIDQTGFKLRRSHRIIRHKKYPFLLGNIDRVITSKNGNGPGILEIKTTSGWSERTWEDEVPLSYFAQVQHYLFVTGYKWANIALLVDGSKFRIVPIDRDDEYIQTGLPYLIKFWNENVLKGIPPAPGLHDDLTQIYPKSQEGIIIEATTETFMAYIKLREIKDRVKALEIQQAPLEGELKIMMGEAEELTYQGKSIVAWKTSKSSKKLDIGKLQLEHPELCQKYLMEVPGSRRFIVK